MHTKEDSGSRSACLTRLLARGTCLDCLPLPNEMHTFPLIPDLLRGSVDQNRENEVSRETCIKNRQFAFSSSSYLLAFKNSDLRVKNRISIYFWTSYSCSCKSKGRSISLPYQKQKYYFSCVDRKTSPVCRNTTFRVQTERPVLSESRDPVKFIKHKVF